MPLLAHFGMGFAGKGINPRVPTWALLGSALLPDILALFLSSFTPTWFHHGLMMDLIWAFLAMISTWLLVSRSNRLHPQQQENKKFLQPTAAALLIGALVISHWILDAIGWPMIMYNPDASGVPLLFDNYITVGLGAYRTWTGTVLMELGFLLVGLLIYFKAQKNSSIK